jgi:hypothetical protein
MIAPAIWSSFVRRSRRVADISLFLTGIYPDRSSFSLGGRGVKSLRAMPLPITCGKAGALPLAAREPEPLRLASVFQDLRKIHPREALNTLNDDYLSHFGRY